MGRQVIRQFIGSRPLQKAPANRLEAASPALTRRLPAFVGAIDKLADIDQTAAFYRLFGGQA